MIFILYVSFGLQQSFKKNYTCYQNSLLKNSQLIISFSDTCIHGKQYNANMKGQTIAKVIRQTLENVGINVTSNNYNESWQYQLEFGSQFTESEYHALVQNNIVVSQIPFHRVFTTKDELARNIQGFTQRYSNLKLIPMTYVVPDASHELFMLLSNNDVKTNFMQFKKPQQSYFIFKKAASARGHGIKLVKSVEELKNAFSTMRSHESAVVQEYLTNSVLIDGYKFDIRIYFVITSIDPFIVHVYRDGIGRLATHKFINPNSFNQDDLKMHLTNFAVNKQQGEGNQNGNVSYKKSYQDIINHLSINKELFLRKTRQDKHNLKQMNQEQLKQHLQDQINKTLYKSLIILKDKLQQNFQKFNLSKSDYNKQFFGLYGADMIFIDNSDALLLEINLQPALGLSTDVDKRIKQQLIKDMFNIIGLRSTIPNSNEYNEKLGTSYAVMFDAFKKYLQTQNQLEFIKFYEENSNEMQNAIIQLVDEFSRQNNNFDTIIPNLLNIEFVQYAHVNKKDKILDWFAQFMKTQAFRESFDLLINIKDKQNIQTQHNKDEL